MHRPENVERLAFERMPRSDNGDLFRKVLMMGSVSCVPSSPTTCRFIPAHSQLPTIHPDRLGGSELARAVSGDGAWGSVRPTPQRIDVRVWLLRDVI